MYNSTRVRLYAAIGQSEKLLKTKTKKSFISLRGYGLAMGLHHFVTDKYLDPQTFTWFPEDRLPGGGVARGGWCPGLGEVRFRWDYSDYGNSGSGARVALSVPLKP